MPKQLTPEGIYRGVATPVTTDEGSRVVQWGYAGKNNTKQVLVYFKITQGEEAGTVLPWFGYFSKDSARRSVESLRACGFKGDDLFVINEQPLDQEVELVVGHNTFDDKTFARVDWVNQIGGGTIKLKAPMREDEVRQFAALMKDSVAKVPAVQSDRVDPSAVVKATPSEASSPAPTNGQAQATPAAWETRPSPAIDAMDDIPF